MNVHELYDRYQTGTDKDTVYFFGGKEITNITAENGGYFLTFKNHSSTCYGHHFFYGDEKITETCKEYATRYTKIMETMPQEAQPPMTIDGKKLLKLYQEKTEPTEKDLDRIHRMTHAIKKLNKFASIGNELDSLSEAIQIVNSERR